MEKQRDDVSKTRLSFHYISNPLKLLASKYICFSLYSYKTLNIERFLKLINQSLNDFLNLLTKVIRNTDV